MTAAAEAAETVEAVEAAVKMERAVPRRATAAKAAAMVAKYAESEG